METGSNRRELSSMVGSYRTYEEWKHRRGLMLLYIWEGFLPYLWGMETGASHYKGIRAKQFLPYLWGMETRHHFVFFKCPDQFLPYLWGMETTSCKRNVQACKRFLPYLWGMETNIKYGKLKRSLVVLTVPMRNGNKFLTWMKKTWITVLTVPMRNGNLFFKERPVHPIVFLPYLWGMETSAACN